jgi:3-deoxy-D-manno-octulosonate 8-phosphate phosphatase (KDO 8-P phosphatase)
MQAAFTAGLKCRPLKATCSAAVKGAMAFDSEQLAGLKAVAFDVDGVLTDGTVTWSGAEEELKSFSFADIMGVSLLRRLGIKMALVSGEASPLVDRYAAKMHLNFVATGTREKAEALRRFSAETGIALWATCFFGDDVNDLPAMEIAGMCACPANAADEVLEYVTGRGDSGFVAKHSGGRGAVRAFADAVVAGRGLLGRDVFQMRPPE